MKQLLWAVAIIATFTACVKKRNPSVYEIPDGYKGWVLIVLDCTNTSRLPVEGGKVIYQIGPDGKLATSSSLETGVAEDEFYYAGSVPKKLSLTAQGGGGQIWGWFTGSCSYEFQGYKGFSCETFFVGTEQEYKKAGQHPNP